MQIIEVINNVSDELRDAKESKYSRTSILSKLKEAMTQFVSESKILKNRIVIASDAGKAEYSLPRYGTSITDWSSGSGVATSTVATYLSLIRLGWRDLDNTGSNVLLRPNSTFERDEVGSTFNASGTPLYHYNDELSFYQFGIWPVPDATAIDASGLNKHIQIDYVRDVLYYSDSAYSTTVDRSSVTENDYLDPDIPEEFLSKIYLLVCFLRLKNSIDPIDVQKAANYKVLYEQELLGKALESGSHMDRYNQLKVQE